MSVNWTHERTQIQQILDACLAQVASPFLVPSRIFDDLSSLKQMLIQQVKEKGKSFVRDSLPLFFYLKGYKVSPASPGLAASILCELETQEGSKGFGALGRYGDQDVFDALLTSGEYGFGAIRQDAFLDARSDKDNRLIIYTQDDWVSCFMAILASEYLDVFSEVFTSLPAMKAQFLDSWQRVEGSDWSSVRFIYQRWLDFL
ncbi:MAG: hypothetical protein JW892_16780 [Anaerolineae bacterium]|nr:hypothetical protein [Anaerolineae bacterium]